MQASAGERDDSSGLSPDSTDPFAAILAIGDSWFWYPKNSLLASILALKQIDPNFKTAHILGKNGALLSDYRTGKFTAMWRNELTAQNFRFSLVLISGGGNDSVDYAFALRPDCTGITQHQDCFDIDKLNQLVDTLIGIMAALVSDVQIAAQRANIRTPPVLLNGYDRPVPDGRNFSPIGGEKFKVGGPWTAPAMDRAKVNPALVFRTQVIGIYIDALNTAMQQLASRTTGGLPARTRHASHRACDVSAGLGQRTASDEIRPHQARTWAVVDAT